MLICNIDNIMHKLCIYSSTLILLIYQMFNLNFELHKDYFLPFFSFIEYKIYWIFNPVKNYIYI